MSGRYVLGVLAALAMSVAGCASAPPPPADTGLSAGAVARAPLTSALAPSPTSSAPRVRPSIHARVTQRRTSSSPVPRTSTRTVAAASREVSAIGDSVMLDARPTLLSRLPGVRIDAEVGRQTDPGIALLRAQQANGTVADTTVFALGTNGPFTPAQIDTVIGLTAGHRLVLVTSHCPYCSWTDTNNADVHRLCIAASHCFVADFEVEADKHPEWFVGDGVHMSVGGAGAASYTAAIVDAITRAP